jgi:phospho-N-acetylmuramoyl-pentapeptide-transferase
MIINIVKVFIPTLVSFGLGMLISPVLAGFLYEKKMWKKKSVQTTLSGEAATISARLHNDEERKTPRMGGVVIWGSTLITILLFWAISYFFPNSLTGKLDFLSRNQTWFPLFILIAGALCGLLDDYLVCSDKGSYRGGGLSLKTRLGFVFFLGLASALWFYFKLDINSIYIPFHGDLYLGFLFIPVFILFVIGIYSGGIIDGVDGLSGGIFAIIYFAYAVLAYFYGQIDLAAYSSVIVGAILAFLWFNIPPARFFNSETGTMALTTSLVVLAFLTKSAAVLPIIGFLLIATSASSILQILSKKYRGGKKIFVVAPLHNHFQAIGWPASKVTMRYWILGIIFAVLGLVTALLG